jgi:16S rRNA (adenine1518-N6/adenine1519-N6)-dimethyltransferase
MSWARRELQALGIPPLRRLGQHFLVDKRVRAKMVETADLTERDVVLEVGPGLGFLTEELVTRTGRVIAIEKDRTLAAHLRSRFSRHKNLTLIQGDALTVQLPRFTKVVSSPPYNISSKLILLLLNSQFKLAVLLLQEEFVRRLSAAPGSRDYGRLTVRLQCIAEAEYIAKVPKSAFYPSPRVDSAVVNITPMANPVRITDNVLFADMVRALFTQRRRRLKGVLTRYLTAQFGNSSDMILSRISVPEKRVYEISPHDLADLSNQISDIIDQVGIGRGSADP